MVVITGHLRNHVLLIMPLWWSSSETGSDDIIAAVAAAVAVAQNRWINSFSQGLLRDTKKCIQFADTHRSYTLSRSPPPFNLYTGAVTFSTLLTIYHVMLVSNRHAFGSGFWRGLTPKAPHFCRAWPCYSTRLGGSADPLMFGRAKSTAVPSQKSGPKARGRLKSA